MAQGRPTTAIAAAVKTLLPLALPAHVTDLAGAQPQASNTVAGARGGEATARAAPADQGTRRAAGARGRVGARARDRASERGGCPWTSRCTRPRRRAVVPGDMPGEEEREPAARAGAAGQGLQAGPLCGGKAGAAALGEGSWEDVAGALPPLPATGETRRAALQAKNATCAGLQRRVGGRGGGSTSKCGRSGACGALGSPASVAAQRRSTPPLALSARSGLAAARSPARAGGGGAAGGRLASTSVVALQRHLADACVLPTSHSRAFIPSCARGTYVCSRACCCAADRACRRVVYSCACAPRGSVFGAGGAPRTRDAAWVGRGAAPLRDEEHAAKLRAACEPLGDAARLRGGHRRHVRAGHGGDCRSQRWRQALHQQDAAHALPRLEAGGCCLRRGARAHARQTCAAAGRRRW